MSQSMKACAPDVRAKFERIGHLLCSVFTEKEISEFEKESQRAGANVSYRCHDKKLLFIDVSMKDPALRRRIVHRGGANCAETTKD